MLEAFLANSAYWFDLIAMVVLGGLLMEVMASPQWSQHQQLHVLFAVFALGHVLWLPGCIVWPWFRSRFGRGAMLGWTVSLAAFPTALLGCMPSYAEVS
jgi:MFS family permease